MSSISAMRKKQNSSLDEHLTDEELLMEEHEIEEERILSERFGEAGEEGTSSSKKKRKKRENISADAFQNDKFAQQQQASNVNGRGIKKYRPTLTAAKLIDGPGSFRKIQSEFPINLHWGRVPSTNDDSIQLAARFSTDMINAYKSHCHGLFPSYAFEDVLIRIQKLTTSKEMKRHLDSMRQDVCRRHLIEKHGVAKTQRLLQSLEELKAHVLSSTIEAMDEKDVPSSHQVHETSSSLSSKQSTNSNATKRKDKISDDFDNEEEASFDDVVGFAGYDES